MMKVRIVEKRNKKEMTIKPVWWIWVAFIIAMFCDIFRRRRYY